MRFVLFVLGLVLGVAITLGYVVFVDTNVRPPAPRVALEREAPITVVLGEPFLAGIVRLALVESAPTSALEPVTVTVDVSDDALVVGADINVLGQQARGTARLRPMLEHGELRLGVIDSTLGGLPLAPMDDAIEQQLNARLHSLFEGVPVTVTGLRLDRARGLILTCEIDLAQLARTEGRARADSAP